MRNEKVTSLAGCVFNLVHGILTAILLQTARLIRNHVGNSSTYKRLKVYITSHILCCKRIAKKTWIFKA